MNAAQVFVLIIGLISAWLALLFVYLILWANILKHPDKEEYFEIPDWMFNIPNKVRDVYYSVIGKVKEVLHWN